MLPLRALLLAIFAASLTTASAAILGSDNFEADTTGAAVPTTGFFGTNLAGGILVRDATTSTVLGSPNKFAQVTGAGRGIFTNTTAGLGFAGNIRTAAFVFAQIDTATTGGLTVGSDTAANGADAGNTVSFNLGTTSATVGNLNSGTTTVTFPKNTAFTLSVIQNDSAAAGSYADPNGGTRTLTAMTEDVWLTNNSTSTATYAFSVAIPAGALDRFGVRQYNGAAAGNYLLDNFQVYDTAMVVTVPEPSTVASVLGLLAVGGTWKSFRRRARAV